MSGIFLPETYDIKVLENLRHRMCGIIQADAIAESEQEIIKTMARSQQEMHRRYGSELKSHFQDLQKASKHLQQITTKPLRGVVVATVAATLLCVYGGNCPCTKQLR